MSEAGEKQHSPLLNVMLAMHSSSQNISYDDTVTLIMSPGLQLTNTVKADKI